MALRSTPPAPPTREVAPQARAPATGRQDASGTQTPDASSPPGGQDAGGTQTAPPRAARLSWRLGRIVPALVLGALVLAAWQFVTQAGLVYTILLPPPADVWRTFWVDLFVPKGLLAQAIVTLEESLGGFAIGTLIALPVGYGIARSPFLARLLQPYIAASQAMPAVALAPLLVLWLPLGLPPVIALCALIIFFPIVVNTALGIRGLDRDLIDAARVAGAGRWARVRYIELPLALPSILAGLRTSLTLSITGAVVGEFVVGGVGLGGSLVSAQANGNPALVFATLLMLGVLAAVLYGGARLSERRLSYLED